jgi:hypothetical protein
MINKNCICCGAAFITKRKDKQVCSKRCSNVISNRKRKIVDKVEDNKRNLSIDNGDLRKCKVCLKWKNKDEDFKKTKITKTYIITKRTCDECKKEKQKNKLRDEHKPELYKDVKEFVLRIKAQNYNCYSIDVWRLIDLYDRVFPSQLNLPHTLYNGKGTDMEMSSIVMFEKVARWYVDERDHFELLGYLR